MFKYYYVGYIALKSLLLKLISYVSLYFCNVTSRLTIDFAGQHCLAARVPWLTSRRWRVYGNPFHPLENKMLEVQFCFVFIRSFFYYQLIIYEFS